MKEKKPNGTIGNTDDCFRTFVGQQLRGYFRKDGDSYLIFDDRRALVFHHETGAYWVANANAVGIELAFIEKRLNVETAALRNVLELAGGHFKRP